MISVNAQLVVSISFPLRASSGYAAKYVSGYVGRGPEKGGTAGEAGWLTLGILVRPVDIVTANDDHGELEALLIRVDQHFGCRLARRVRVGGRQDARL